MPFGKIFRKSSTGSLRRSDMKMSACRCLFRKACSIKKKTTLRVSRPRSPGSPTAAMKSSKNAFACARPPKPCSVNTIKQSCILTAICRSFTISGFPWCAGKRPPVRFCVPANFCGRRGTPSTPPPRKRAKRQSACSTCMRISVKTILQCRSSKV